MKRWLFALFTAALFGLWGCGGTVAEPQAGSASKSVLNQYDPVPVVEAVFLVAAGKLPAQTLAQLCDPGGQNDIDTRRICDYAAGFEPGGEFVMFFQKGEVTAPATIRGNTATVPFAYGPDGTQQAVMLLVQREGKWYLSSF